MTALHDLHRYGLLILPNAWDAGSAALMKSLGANAIASSSAAVDWAQGWPDGDALPIDRLVAVTADIVRGAQGLPVSIDMEGGYSGDPAAVAALAERLVEAGAQGINLEDGGRDPAQLMAKIRAVKRALGSRLFLNARTDVWLAGLAPEDPVAEAARRGRLYAEAGADGLFTPGITDTGQIEAMVNAASLPLNVMARAALPDAKVLAELGVRRLSAGSGLAQAAWGHVAGLARQFLYDGQADMDTGALGWSDLNALMPGEGR